MRHRAAPHPAAAAAAAAHHHHAARSPAWRCRECDSQVSFLALQRQEGSPWLQSATTAAQLISKPSCRDGPQPGYCPAQLCAAAHPGRPRPHRPLLQLFRPLMTAYCFPEVRSPCSTGFWFPKSLESWLRLFLVYCNTKDKPLQTSAFPINLVDVVDFSVLEIIYYCDIERPVPLDKKCRVVRRLFISSSCNKNLRVSYRPEQN